MNNMKLSLLYSLLFVISIIVRCYTQFHTPAFNIDEVNLAFNIIDKSFIDLLKPLDYYQSAPPGFLIIIKLITKINLIPQWVQLKIFNFIVSCLILYIPLRILRMNKFGLEYLFPYVILLFNPFIIYNSLTLKQYGIDLLGTFLITYCHTSHSKLKFNIILIFLWSWFSNVAIFAALAMSTLSLLRTIKFERKIRFTNILRIIAPVVALFPYVAYVLYYLSFSQAANIKNYMVNYWKPSFLPFNGEIFEYLFRQIHAYYIYFLNAYEILGLILMCLLFIFSIVELSSKKKLIHHNEIRLLIFMITFHLLFSAFKLYPFSDRLLLYTFVLIFFTLSGIIKSQLLRFKSVGWLVAIVVGIFITSYSTYGNHKENDVLSLLRCLNESNNSKVYLTSQVNDNINKFNLITEGYFEREIEQIQIISEIEDSDIVISRAANKIKPKKTSKDTDFVKTNPEFKKFELLKQLGGYNIYSRKII